ncbi:MAG: hypothetical protein BGO29_07210 [Bacteroidales bacterium 36-12]|nr:MAG: hypothetical protein BGO29_07210 [Bacteroidales bacterium 36-12]
MKLLIIGGGAVAESSHIPAAIHVVGLDNIVLAEPNDLQSKKLRDKFNIKQHFSDFTECLNKVDAVVIATPPHTHNDILAKCIEAGLPVLCEKPISDQSKETKKILQQNINDLVIGACHTYRLFPNRLKVKRLIADGYFGDNVRIEINEGFPSNWPTVSGYCFRKELVPGGVLFDAGIHSLDFILWTLGMPLSINYKDDEEGGLESNAEMELIYEKASAYFKISRTTELSNTIVVSGNGRKVVLDVFEMNNILENDIQTIADENCLMDWTNIGYYQLQNFIDAVKKQAVISCTADKALQSIEILERAYKQKTKVAKTPKPIGKYKGKKVLITGGTGFIGSLLTERLVKDEEADVRVMVHNWKRAAYVSRFDVGLVQADITNYDEVEKVVEGCDYVFHCVGVGGTPDYANKINVLGTENVVRASAKHQAERVVYLSSVVVHGDKISDGMNEDTPFVSYGDSYADAKITAEEVFWKLTKEFNLEASVIRPTYVWGPMSEWYTMEIIKQMKEGRFYWVDKGSGSSNAVYVENLIDMMLICGQHPGAVGQAFLSRDGEKQNWSEFYSHYARMLNIDPTSFKSIPLQDGLKRKFLKLAKKNLTKSINALWERVLQIEEDKPFVAKWFYRAPRKMLKMILKSVVKHLPEKSSSEMAIYNFQGFIDISKSKELLAYEPRFSTQEAMAETEKWLSDSNLL